MKTITIRIPTSFKEWKNWVDERVKSRRRHNADVLWDFAQDISREAQSENLVTERIKSRRRHNADVLWDFARAISREAQSDYWKNDVSEIMKRNVFRLGGSSKLTKLYFEAKNKLK